MQPFLPRSAMLGIAGLLSMPGFAYAESASSPYFADLPVVLTASRMAQSPLDAPAPVTIIDREMIDASGFTEIHDLLRLVPGFMVSDWPEGSPTIASHGLGDAYGRRIKVLIDGRTINSPLWGDVKWQDLPLRVDDIERIEVVRGPNGAAYGANAFQGVINIMTRSPATEEGVNIIARAGANEYHDVGVRLNGGSGTPLDWRISLSQRRGENFHSYSNESLETIERGVLNFQALAQLSERDQLNFQAGTTRGDDRRGIPQSLTLPLHTDRTVDNYVTLGWRRSIDTESELSLVYYHQSREEQSKWIATVGALKIPIDKGVDTQRDDIELQLTHRFNPQWHVLWGAGARYDTAQSVHYFTTDDTIRTRQWQTFGSVNWRPVDALQVNAGGTFERHDYSGTMFSPRLALNYMLSPQSTVRLSSGVAYRAPSLMESRALESVQFGGKLVELFFHSGLHVNPEKIRYTELGYVAHFDKVGIDLDTRVFHERYSEYIDDQICRHRGTTRRCQFAEPANFAPLRNPRRGETSYFLNSGAFVMEGAEASLNWNMPGWGRLIVSQAFIDIRDDGDVLDAAIEKSAPSSVSSLLLIKDLPDRWKASVGYYHNHPMYWLNDGDRLPSRDRYDLKLARAFGSVGSGNEFAIVVQNGGVRWREFHEGNFRQEAMVFASVKWTL